MLSRRHEDALGFLQRERSETRARNLCLLLSRDRDSFYVAQVGNVAGLETGLLELRAIQVRRRPADLDGPAKDLCVVRAPCAVVERLALVQQSGLAFHGAQG